MRKSGDPWDLESCDSCTRLKTLAIEVRKCTVSEALCQSKINSRLQDQFIQNLQLFLHLLKTEISPLTLNHQIGSVEGVRLEKKFGSLRLVAVHSNEKCNFGKLIRIFLCQVALLAGQKKPSSFVRKVSRTRGNSPINLLLSLYLKDGF